MSEQVSLSDWEKQQAENAHNRARIRQILKSYPEGLTVQQLLAKELDVYGFTFLTDNRLREMRKKGEVESFGEKPKKWKLTEV